MSNVPTTTEAYTNSAFSICSMIAMTPVIEARIPENIARTTASTKAGLRVISSKIVLLGSVDEYSKLVKSVPTKNRIDIATINPSDHLPHLVVGLIFICIFYQLVAYK